MACRHKEELISVVFSTDELTIDGTKVDEYAEGDSIEFVLDFDADYCPVCKDVKNIKKRL